MKTSRDHYKGFLQPQPGSAISLTWSYFSLQKLPKLSPPFQWTLLKSYRKTRNVCLRVPAQGHCALWTLLCEPSSGFTFWGNQGVCPQRTGSWPITLGRELLHGCVQQASQVIPRPDSVSLPIHPFQFCTPQWLMGGDTKENPVPRKLEVNLPWL